MTLPIGIGPHEGRELELMLTGVKKLASFTDVIPSNGIIAEEIIPEVAFAPYVQANKILRIAKEFKNNGTNHVIRCVCFTLPGQEWRAHCLLWMKERLFSGIKSDDADTVFEGRLLGYSEADIQSFLNHKK